MTIENFENGYWYAKELKEFAKQIGINGVSKLRKDELESIISKYLSLGILPQNITKISATNLKDSDLTLKKQIINYTSTKETKNFILSEARKIQPNFPKKSGVWYWLNRWREEQMQKEAHITYEDLVKQFLILSNKKERLPRIPSTKFNNFISDFLKAKEGSRSEAMNAWEILKKLKIPKTYEAWKKYNLQGDIDDSR